MLRANHPRWPTCALTFFGRTYQIKVLHVLARSDPPPLAHRLEISCRPAAVPPLACVIQAVAALSQAPVAMLRARFITVSKGERVPLFPTHTALTMKLLAVAALATLAAAELSPCITQCAENVTATNATACPSKDL